MRFNFGLEDEALELSQDQKNVLWIPAIPARELKAYQGRRISITEKYLKAAASETKRFYNDMKARGAEFLCPILCAHDDKGRRSGVLLDFAVRDYNGTATLFVKGEFIEDAYQAILKGSLAHGSISILPEYKDPQTGIIYAPFINEWSETNTPVVKDFSVSELLETPSQLAMLNLTLSEDKNMTPEEKTEFIGEIRSAVVDEIATALGPIVERLDALDGGESEEETEETEETAEEAPAVAASEVAPVVDFAAFVARVDKLEAKLDRAEKVRAKGTQVSTTGVPISASEKAPVASLEKQLANIKKQDPSLYGIAAVRALQEAKNV